MAGADPTTGGAPTAVSAPTRHRDRLRRYMALMHGALVLAFAVVAVATGLTSPVPSTAAHLGAGLGLAALAAMTALRGERPLNLALAVPLGLVGALPAFAGDGDVTGPLALTAGFLAAVRTLRVPGAVAVVGATLLAALGIRAATSGDVDLGLVGSYLLGVANTFVAAAFVGSLERSTEAMDAAERRTRRELLRLEAQRARDSAVEGARRVLHDDVLSALRAIAAAEVPPEHQVRLCARAVAAVDELLGSPEEVGDAPAGTGPARADRWLRRVREESPVPIDVAASDDATSWRLDPTTEVAARRAVLEAVRNAVRHAGAGRVGLRLRRRGEALVVEVRDRGPGMAPDAVEGFGLTTSVRGAVVAVGGRVEVDTGPRGTTVRLAFDALPEPEQTSLLARTYERTMRAGAEQTLVAATMVPLVLVWLAIGGTFALRSADVTQQLLLLTACTCLAALITLRLRSRPPGPVWLVGVVGGLLVTQATGMSLLPPGALLDLRSWSVGYLATPLIVLCFLLPVRWGLGVVAAHVLLVLALTAVRPDLTAGLPPIGPLNAVTTTPLLTVLLGLGLRRNSAVIRAEQELSLAASAELWRRRSTGLASSLHLDHTRAAAVPWLRSVADGSLDPARPEVRARARLLMLEARDDLHAPGFHTPELRAATSAFRAGGGAVDIRPGFPPGAHDRLSGAALREVLARVDPRHRITLTPPSGPRRLSRLVILPPPPPGALGPLERDDRLRLVRDDLAATLEFEDVAL